MPLAADVGLGEGHSAEQLVGSAARLLELALNVEAVRVAAELVDAGGGEISEQPRGGSPACESAAAAALDDQHAFEERRAAAAFTQARVGHPAALDVLTGAAERRVRTAPSVRARGQGEYEREAEPAHRCGV